MSFEKAREYASKFEPFREFYQENDSLDVESLQEEDHGMYSYMCSAVLPDTACVQNVHIRTYAFNWLWNGYYSMHCIMIHAYCTCLGYSPKLSFIAVLET